MNAPERSWLRSTTVRLVRLVLPPLLLVPLDTWRRTREEPERIEDAGESLPFDGAGPLWVALVDYVERYAEWGTGESTAFVLENCGCLVRSVDTSADWLERTLQSWASSPRVKGVHVDLGPLLEWGRPASYRWRNRFDEYLKGPFGEDFSPQLLLVDGRFRVACFLSALLNVAPGTLIVFDDYRYRAQYHVVEEVLSPIARAGRQAVFVRPQQIDEAAVRQLLVDFKHVMD